MKCKISSEEIKPFMTFGKMPLANGFLEKEYFESEFTFEMEVGFCEKLSLFQLNETPKPEQIFGKKYPFYTGSSEYMKTHFNKFAKWLKKEFLKSNSKLIEIGSNDGTMLKNFTKTNIDYIGFEPAESVANEALKNNIKTINNFFTQKNIQNLRNFKKRTDVICAANVICHVPNLKDLIVSVDELLSSNGVFVFEEPYLGSMFTKVSYDQIYDEHVFIFSLSSVKKIFDIFDFELIDAMPQSTHGGSMRYVVGRKNKHKINTRVENGLTDEKEKKLDNIQSCLNFKESCENSKNRVSNYLKKIKGEGKKICGYAATSKSTTILNYCKLSVDIIDFICDTTEEKIGKFSPGMHIPIVSVSHFHKNLPDVAYLFAWNHKDEIFSKEKEFLKKGGKWFSHVSL
jgi:methylation protein EvaC|tara:strand:+ start:1721 stop:2920 length:1200 start_codon:yes stop_codon:yes gene_type:complete